MKTYKIKASRDLFEQYRKLSVDIAILAAIIQNDVEISESDLNMWSSVSTRAKEQLQRITWDTIVYITKID